MASLSCHWCICLWDKAKATDGSLISSLGKRVNRLKKQFRLANEMAQQSCS